MKGATGFALALMLAFGAAAPVHATEGQIAVVAAENFYGDIARQIGGDRVAVVSIMNNPDQDPHLFETTPSIVRQLAAAQIVILNGANYDLWMDKLLAATPRTGRTVIGAAQLTGRKPGDNPHLWYDPVTMPAVATALAEALAKARAFPGLAGMDLAKVVTTARPYEWAEGGWQPGTGYRKPGRARDGAAQHRFERRRPQTAIRERRPVVGDECGFRADDPIAMRLEQIVEELHVELVVFHDQDRLGHWPALLPRRGRRALAVRPEFRRRQVLPVGVLGRETEERRETEAHLAKPGEQQTLGTLADLLKRR